MNQSHLTTPLTQQDSEAAKDHHKESSAHLALGLNIFAFEQQWKFKTALTNAFFYPFVNFGSYMLAIKLGHYGQQLAALSAASLGFAGLTIGGYQKKDHRFLIDPDVFFVTKAFGMDTPKKNTLLMIILTLVETLKFVLSLALADVIGRSSGYINKDESYDSLIVLLVASALLSVLSGIIKGLAYTAMLWRSNDNLSELEHMDCIEMCLGCAVSCGGFFSCITPSAYVPEDEIEHDLVSEP